MPSSTDNTTRTDLQPHPLSECFPMMDESAFEKLKADIEKRGLVEPIWLYQGQILDGRNRYRACRELGIDPATRQYLGDEPSAFVVSLNLERRHLTSSQRGAVAVELLPHLEAEARERQAHGQTAPGATLKEKLPEAFADSGQARDHAAKLVGTNPRYVSDAKSLAKNEPALFEQVKKGEVTIPEARRVARESRQQKEPQEASETESTTSPVSVKKLPRDVRVEQIERLAKQGYRADQIAHSLAIGIHHVKNIARAAGIPLPDEHLRTIRVNPIRVIEQTVHGLSGYALGLKTLDLDAAEIDPVTARGWTEELAEYVKPINKLRQRLLEIANG